MIFLSAVKFISEQSNLLGALIGIGGAGFPTHVKLKPPADNPVDTLLLNGAECEPYITADHRMMVEKTVEIIEGAKILLRILGIRECVIGIENNKPDAITLMKDLIKDYEGIEVAALKKLRSHDRRKFFDGYY